ncbi:MAG: hypothetical protein C5S41_08055 [Candidatus Methanomarinus sp.]|nr:MAG: hypothetical protein C5S41_08055 [ANME-2 cluster archaeon]KAF5425744.1 hypothetical protein C5S42_09790 [ANME-2 cluster archaeon]
MLTNSYIHIQGIGVATEKKIWKCGIRSWDEFKQNSGSTGLPESRIKVLLQGVNESQQRLKTKDHIFFAGALPKNEHWRAYRAFKDQTLFLDIETTGLAPWNSEITLIGVHGGGKTRVFIRGVDLEEFEDVLDNCKTLVTFNGARFDLPFIKYHFPQITFDQLHIDLMSPLRRIGLKGGLKHIETVLGISRSDGTAGLSGFDAVRLWYQYQRGSKEALDTLIKYNIEDIQNLETIIDMVYPKLIENYTGRAQT